MDRFKAIDSFMRVAKTRSFSEAANQTGMSRSMISRHVRMLEGQLGVQLLNRTTRSVKLTGVGVAYYEFCERMLRQWEEKERSVLRSRHELRGSIKVAAPKSFGSMYLSDAVAGFSLQHPHIKVSLILEDYTFRVYDFMEKGLDVAIRLSPIRDSAIIARKIAMLRWVLCASPQYLSQHGEPKAPGDLSKHQCLAHLRLDAHDRIWRLMGPRGQESIRIDGPFSSNSGLVLRKAVLAGLGIGLLPWYAVGDELKAGSLVQILPRYKVADRPLYVVYPHGKFVAPAIRAFVGFLSTWFRGAMGKI